MEAHATQVKTRTYVEMQLTRATSERPAGRRRPRHRPLPQRPARRRLPGAAGPRRAAILTWISDRPLRIGITCYPSVGGSGILASALGDDLARRGHDVHFISYERPFRLPPDAPRLHFHPVGINAYGLFKYPDYTLPLSVKMAEVSREHRLDVLHVHYAVPHATAAILARSMLPRASQPQVVTTLHGTDTTLLGRDPGYGPAIRHALKCSDAVTIVSEYLTQRRSVCFASTGRST